MASAPGQPAGHENRNRRVGLIALGVAIAMLGMGYAAVPLYRIFCQVTGFGGTTQRVEESAAAGVRDTGVPISIRFDANVERGMPWEFKPEQVTQDGTVGARKMALFRAKNLSDTPVQGTASFNVSPESAGKYFTKVQCFCFTEQTLQPGEEMRMPVVYYIDPAILDDKDTKDVQQITLSYTFHPDLASIANTLDRTGSAR